MKTSRRIARSPSASLKRLAALVAERAGREAESRSSRLSFQPLSEAEAEATLGGELWAALSSDRA